MSVSSSQVAVLFPGQGSQYVGMGQALAAAFPEAREVFAQADEVLGYALSRIMWEGPDTLLDQTEHTQPAVFVHAVAAWRVLKAHLGDWTPRFAAGHSLGELTTLVVTEALDFTTALRLVHRRAHVMAEAGRRNPGRMAALLGLSIEKVEGLVQTITERIGFVQVANDNCPGQVVISGTPEGVEAAVERARELGARRAIVLKVSVAAHSILMAPAQEAFRAALAQARLRAPRYPVVGNVAARALHAADALFADLSAQLTGPVRWRESVEHMLEEGVHTFVEFGPGRVLSNLVKRIRRNTRRANLDAPEDLKTVLRLLTSETPIHGG